MDLQAAGSLGGRRLVSTPSPDPRAWLGITIALAEGSPEFDALSSPRFREALPIKSQLLYQLS